MSEPTTVSDLQKQANQALAAIKDCIKNQVAPGVQAWAGLRRLRAAARTLPDHNNENDQLHESVATLASYHAIAIFLASTCDWGSKIRIARMIELITELLQEEHTPLVLVYLHIGHAMLERAAGNRLYAYRAAQRALAPAQRMDRVMQGSIWLLCGEVGPSNKYTWALGKSLRFFRADRRDHMSVLLELRTRLQLMKHYKFNVVARTWHSLQVDHLSKQVAHLHISRDQRARVLDTKMVWTFMPYDA